jgi:predicted ferric reductase
MTAPFVPDTTGRTVRTACWLGLAALQVFALIAAADVTSPMLVAGRTLGLVALVLLALQPITALRFRPLETAFGQDRLLAFHRWSGTAALTLAALHPLVVYGPGQPLAGPSSLQLWREGLGALALIGLWLAVLPSLNRRFVRLAWEPWRRLHIAAACATGALVLTHALALASAQREGWRLGAWTALALVWLAPIVWKTTVSRHRDAARHPYTVTGVRAVANGITELALSPAADTAGLRFRAGQFAYLSLHSAAVPDEAHPFTLAAAPDADGRVQFAVKALGDFTAKLGSVKPGDRATLEGPYGRFTPSRFGGEVTGLTLIAGGIGITPLLSVLRTLAAAEFPFSVTLLWFCRTPTDAPYRETLEAWAAAHPAFVFRPLYTREGGQRSGMGTLAALLPRYARGMHAMVCGPDGLMRAALRTLRESGYPRRAIHAERFNF